MNAMLECCLERDVFKRPTRFCPIGSLCGAPSLTDLQRMLDLAGAMYQQHLPVCFMSALVRSDVTAGRRAIVTSKFAMPGGIGMGDGNAQDQEMMAFVKVRQTGEVDAAMAHRGRKR